MHQTNLNALDLNLLVALEALLATSSVSRAAEQVGLSQPAMSRALDRLRHMLDDPLLVRSGRSMTLTPRAELLIPELDAAMAGIRHLLRPNEFDPARSQLTFKILGPDHVVQILVPAVLKRLRQQAPAIKLDLISLSKDAFDSLMAGEIDLCFGVVDNGPDVSKAYHQALFEDHFVVMMAKDHPLAEGPLDLQSFAGAAHAMITITGKGKGAVDEMLARHGLERDIMLRIPHFLSVHAIIAETDFLISIPASLAATLPKDKVVIRDLPEEIRGKPYTVSQIWHERFHRDPAQRWLRGLVRDAVREVVFVAEDN